MVVSRRKVAVAWSWTTHVHEADGGYRINSLPRNRAANPKEIALSDTSSPQPVGPLAAAWSIDTQETVLLRGAGRITGQSQDRETELFATWQPELDVRFRQKPNDVEDLEWFFAPRRDEVQLRLLEYGIDAPVVPEGGGSHGGISAVTWGDDRSVYRLRVHLTNFPHVLLPVPLSSPDGAVWRGTFTVKGGPWVLRLDTRRETSETVKRLRADERYAVTHIGELSRADDRPFGVGEIQEALTCIHYLFSFARTAWAAPMLPVGFDQGDNAVWWQASALHCTAGLGRGVTWLDRNDGAGLQEVARLWLDLWQDPLWRQVLRHAVTYYLEANRQGGDAPSFLEVKYTMAQAALELLAWAILKQDPETASGSGPWRGGGGGAAEANVRELLTWAAIPSAVPAELPDAVRDLRARKGWLDAAPFVPWLRNQVVHPRLRRDGCFGPTHEIVMSGWMLACWYVELVLLRRLGYGGRVSSRLQPGHWVGQTIPVPWANP